MRTRGHVLRVLAVFVLLCVALVFGMRSCAARNLQALGEVTAVLDGDRPGTVVVRTVRFDRAESWLVDDAGEAVAMLGPSDGGGEPQARQCLGQQCYRVTGGALRVEQSTDGGATFSPAWEVGGHAYTVLMSTYPQVGDPGRHLSSLSLVVHAVPAGHVVFVADGRDGLLYRDPAGAWHRRGVPDSGEGCCFYDAPLHVGPGWTVADLAVPVGGAVAGVILIVGLVAARRSRTWRRVPVVVAIAALGGAAAGRTAPLEEVGMYPGFMYSVPIVLGIAVGGSIIARAFVVTPAGPGAGAAAVAAQRWSAVMAARWLRAPRVAGGPPMVTGERFEVRTDQDALRRFIRRMTWWTVGTGAAAAIAFGVSAGLLGGVVGGVAAPLAGGAVVGLFGYYRGCTARSGVLSRLSTRVELDRVAVVDDGGIWMPVPGAAAGSVTLPWSAVGEVDVRRVLGRRAIARIRLQPGVTPDHPGAVGLDDPVTWPMAYTTGLDIGTRFTDTDVDAVVAAIERFRPSAVRV